MKKFFLFVFAILISSWVTTSCKFAKNEELGDTVAASVFEPFEPRKQKSKDTTATLLPSIHDSIGIYFIGEGSTRAQLQLVSYPSRRDTLLYYKARHVKVIGSAQIGNTIRVGFFQLPSGDSIVDRVEQIKIQLPPSTTE